MTDTKKQILSRLMGLNSKSADEQLVKMAKEMIGVIKASRDNDEIFDQLDTLKEFVYKAPNEAIEAISFIVDKTPFSPTIHKVPFEYEGKSHNDLLLKCLELLARIRYLVTDETLKLLAKITLHEDSKIRNEALRVLKELTEYDYNLLTKTKLGYSVQRKILDFILSWSGEKKLKYFDFIETTTTALLSSSIGGESWDLNEAAQYTLTWYSGAISPTDFLKKIRREAIDLVYELYESTEDLEKKLKLIKVLEEATRGPINTDHYKNVSSMLSEDKEYIADVYQKIIFDSQDDNVVAPLGIVAEIEERIYWLNKNDEKKNDKLAKLRARILKNKQYHLFHLLVGHLLAYADGEDWREAEKIRNQEIDQLVESIDEKELDVWFQQIDMIASQHDLVDVGEFLSFNSFLFKLSKIYPQKATYFLDQSLEKDSQLLLFAEHILRGFRSGLHFIPWDRYEEKILSSRHIDLINKLLFSLNLYDEVDLVEFIREKDIVLLENITRQYGEFSFLKKVANREFHYALFNAILRNFKRAPERMNQLIKEELTMVPDYLEIYFRELPFAIHRKWVEISDFQPETIEVIKEKLTEVLDLDWHVQEFMLEIGKQYGLRFITDVFSQRVKRNAQRKGGKFWKTSKRYEAVPYHLNDELRLFIVEHPEYIEVANEWVAGMTVKWSTYNFQITHLLQRLGSKFEEIVLSLIKKGGKPDLVKVSHLLRQFEGSNFDLCIELVRKTQDKHILDQVRSDMYATGVVSGEYGLAEAFKRKAEALEKYKDDKDKNVRDFSNQMIKSFLAQSNQERQHTDEDRQLRKVEFES